MSSPPQHRHCERSEAIQHSRAGKQDCFVAALLALTIKEVNPGTNDRHAPAHNEHQRRTS